MSKTGSGYSDEDLILQLKKMGIYSEWRDMQTEGIE